MNNSIDTKKILIIGIVVLIPILIISIILMLTRQKTDKNNSLTKTKIQNDNTPVDSKIEKNDFSPSKISSQFFEDYFKDKYKSISNDEISKKILQSKKQELLTARRILYWILSFRELEKMPESDNIALYPMAIVCNQKTCKKEGSDKQITTPIIFTTWEIYKKTGDSALFKVFEKDLDTIKNQTFQTDYLHCFFTNKLKEQNALEEKYKQILSQICRNSRRYIVHINLSSPYADKIPPSLTDFSFLSAKAKLEGTTLEINKKSTPVSVPADEYIAFLYATHSTEMISMAKEFESRFYVQLSRYYYDMSLEYLAKNSDIREKTNIYPYLAMTSLLLSEESIDQDYKKMFDYLEPLAITTNRENTKQLIHIAFFEDFAFEKTGEIKYKTDVVNILSYLLKNKMDKNGIKSDNEYTVDNKFIYPVRENILFAYLLSKYEKIEN